MAGDTAHHVVVTWCVQPDADVLALLPHSAEPLRAASEADLRQRVTETLDHQHGSGGYDVTYRRVSPNAFGA